MCGRIRSLPLRKRRHPIRFPIALSLVLVALLYMAGTAGAQQTFFMNTVAGPSSDTWPNYPNSVAVASDGTLYLADRGAHSILKVTTDGTSSIFAGTGVAGFSGDREVATAAQLNTPTGVAVTADGRTVYIADRLNHRIRKIDVETRIISTIAGTGSVGFSGDNGAATAAVLNNPIDVAVDGDGNVYIADLENHRIRKVTVATGIIDTIAGSGPYGAGTGGYSGDGVSATAARLNQPVGVAVASDGTMYISDLSNQRVRKVAPPNMDGSRIITDFAGTGTAGFNEAADQQATDSQLNNPIGVTVASNGTVYISDLSNNRVRAVATDGVITTFAGGGPTTPGFTGDGGPATAARLVNPRDVALDSSGNLYIAFQGTNQQGGVRKVDTSGTITTFVGGPARGFSGDNGPATAARLGGPRGVAVDSNGNVYLADSSNNRIRKVDTSGTITTFADAGISGPYGIAVDSGGNVYVAQDHSVLKADVSTDPPTISTLAGGASSGFSGDTMTATAAMLNEPRGVAVDSSGNVYIADSGNERIRKINVSADPPTINTIAGTGTAGFNETANQQATDSQLDNPFDVAVDSSGNVYIADYFNHRIRKIDVSADPPTISTLAGTGTQGFSGDGGQATAAKLTRPGGVAVASDGTVYIADLGNNRIRAVATNGTITTVAGTGRGSFARAGRDGGPATAANLFTPEKVAVSSTGAVYIAELNGYRIRVLTTNGQPRAGDTSPTTPTGTPVTITVPVSDPNNDMLTVTVTTPPANGTTTVSGTTIHYTPNAGFSGVDTFEYTVSDGQGGSTTATVRVGVGVGAPPPPPRRPPTTGGGSRSRPRDDHGNTAAQASRVQLNTRTGSATTSGQLQTAGDVDYFQLTVPDAGILFVETTGSTNTIGTLWQDDQVLGHAIEGGSGQNFGLGVSVQSGQVVIAVQGFGDTTGRYALRTTFVAGFLENPSPNSSQSGIGVLSGWVCDADQVMLKINGRPFSAAYGTDRGDTQDACGDTDNGFGLLFNWNELGDGRHEVVALVNGVELSRTSVTVTTLGTAFLREASGTCDAIDFPSTGEHVTLVWQEAKQNFVITDGGSPPTGSSAVTSEITGFLENPAPNSFQSGIGTLSGWVCEAESVILEIDGQTVAAAYGTDRADTANACGDTDNGFGLLFNWNELGDGDYEVIARANGVAFDRATVRVVTLGEPFLRGVSGTCEAADFPEVGDTVTLTWQTAQQNFVITAVR